MSGYGSLEFNEAVEYFQNKVNVPTEEWTDVVKEAHDIAFTVAGVTEGEMLADFNEAIDSAIVDGTTLEQFRKAFDSIVEQSGWEYEGERDWRTWVIYDTNMRQSYNAGREQQMQNPQLRKRRPYGQYIHGNPKEPREEHLAWDGKVVPLDDPWWQTHSPSNGWGCTCKKFMLSDADVERLGLVVESGGDLPYSGTSVFTDKNGVTHEVPEGVDYGFDYTPGVNDLKQLVEAAQESIATFPPMLQEMINDFLKGIK
jgi:uncharacterized protein with gpF-like domain